ncbi:hypothetical protein ACA910_010808 [Epithemia clementina (nom. ined.)]
MSQDSLKTTTTRTTTETRTRTPPPPTRKHKENGNHDTCHEKNKTNKSTTITTNQNNNKKNKKSEFAAGGATPATVAPTNGTTAPLYFYELTDVDVLLGRGSGFAQLPGNVRFRRLVHPLRGPYHQAKLVGEKRTIVVAAYNQVKQKGGRFLEAVPWAPPVPLVEHPVAAAATSEKNATVTPRQRQHQGIFREVSLSRAYEKCAQALQERKWTPPPPGSSSSSGAESGHSLPDESTAAATTTPAPFSLLSSNTTADEPAENDAVKVELNNKYNTQSKAVNPEVPYSTPPVVVNGMSTPVVVVHSTQDAISPSTSSSSSDDSCNINHGFSSSTFNPNSSTVKSGQDETCPTPQTATEPPQVVGLALYGNQPALQITPEPRHDTKTPSSTLLVEATPAWEIPTKTKTMSKKSLFKHNKEVNKGRELPLLIPRIHPKQLENLNHKREGGEPIHHQLRTTLTKKQQQTTIPSCQKALLLSPGEPKKQQSTSTPSRKNIVPLSSKAREQQDAASETDCTITTAVKLTDPGGPLPLLVNESDEHALDAVSSLLLGIKHSTPDNQRSALTQTPTAPLPTVLDQPSQSVKRNEKTESPLENLNTLQPKSPSSSKALKSKKSKQPSIKKALQAERKQVTATKLCFVTVLNDNDVLFGRGNPVNQHPGNIRFRELCASYRAVYLKLATSKKRPLAESIVEMCQGRFLELDPNDSSRYVFVSYSRCVEKVCQALREKAWERLSIGQSVPTKTQLPPLRKTMSEAWTTAAPAKSENRRKRPRESEKDDRKESCKTPSSTNSCSTTDISVLSTDLSHSSAKKQVRTDRRPYCLRTGSHISIYRPSDDKSYGAVVLEVDDRNEEINLVFIRYILSDRHSEWINLNEHEYKLLLEPSEQPPELVSSPSAAVMMMEKPKMDMAEKCQRPLANATNNFTGTSLMAPKMKCGQVIQRAGRRTLFWGSNNLDKETDLTATKAPVLF